MQTISFLCNGQSHSVAFQRDARMLTVKYGNASFLKEMGLVSGQYMADLPRDPTLTTGDFLASHKRARRRRTDAKTVAFFGCANAR